MDKILIKFGLTQKNSLKIIDICFGFVFSIFLGIGFEFPNLF